MQTTIKGAIKEGHARAKNEDWTPGEGGSSKNWKPIKPQDHPNQTLLVVDQPQFVATRQINRRGWGATRFKIRAWTGQEAAKIASAFVGAIYTDKPSKDDRALNETAREARI